MSDQPESPLGELSLPHVQFVDGESSEDSRLRMGQVWITAGQDVNKVWNPEQDRLALKREDWRRLQASLERIASLSEADLSPESREELSEEVERSKVLLEGDLVPLVTIPPETDLAVPLVRAD